MIKPDFLESQCRHIKVLKYRHDDSDDRHGVSDNKYLIHMDPDSAALIEFVDVIKSRYQTPIDLIDEIDTINTEITHLRAKFNTLQAEIEKEKEDIESSPPLKAAYENYITMRKLVKDK